MRITEYNDKISSSTEGSTSLPDKRIEKPMLVKVTIKEVLKISGSITRFIGYINQPNDKVKGEEITFYTKVRVNISMKNSMSITILRRLGPKLIVCDVHGCL